MNLSKESATFSEQALIHRELEIHIYLPASHIALKPAWLAPFPGP
jgi:hypothetical protein